MNLRNNVILIGRVATLPKVIKINTNIEVLSFRLAVDNFYKSKKTQNLEKDTQFIPLMIFGSERIKKAQENLAVGSMIDVNGSIWYETFKDEQNNQFKNYFNIIVNKYIVLKKVNYATENQIKNELESKNINDEDINYSKSNIKNVANNNKNNDDFFTLPDDFWL